MPCFSILSLLFQRTRLTNTNILSTHDKLRARSNAQSLTFCPSPKKVPAGAEDRIHQQGGVDGWHGVIDPDGDVDEARFLKLAEAMAADKVDFARAATPADQAVEIAKSVLNRTK